MDQVISYILTSALIFLQAGFANSNTTSQAGFWTQVCGSSQTLWIDLRGENDPLPFPAPHKACHAICCSRETDEPDENDDKTSH